MKLAFLKYVFMLDPSKTFAHAYEFESLFSKFLKEHSLVAEVVESVPGSGPDKMVWIKPNEDLVTETRPESHRSTQRFLDKERKTKVPKKNRPKKVQSIEDLLAVKPDRSTVKPKSGNAYLGQIKVK